MKLFYSPGACSLSPHIVLEESGLPYEAILASTKSHKLQDGTDFYTLNPLGYVPLLELDSGERLREGPAIVQYVADQVPDKRLAPPAGTLERYRLQEWLTFIGTELHKSYSPLFKPSTPEEYKPIAREHLDKRYAWVDEQLAGKTYLLGETFTAADAYLFTVTGWAKFTGLDLSGYEHLQAFQARVAARPAVQAALKAEGLLK
ncbi:glutathione S-transferase [Comamonas sp. BIGb0124]|uniref:glutathione transferase GstA n=1 Tax=Comamonas sp. BIGb0124 TaxID=2485130 RepID=UPI000F464093|nr:glutathione transferase GstA [Comamonas sp. BIGb0124]ROR20902.1 glutathione S-transferase [Comamonas sp. BIGb0124]